MTSGSAVFGGNHVGIATPDIDASVRWYVAVLGMRLLRGPETIQDASLAGAVHKAVFGPAFTGGKVAFLSAADGFGLELFEILGAPRHASTQTSDAGIGLPSWPSVFHLAVTSDNVEETVVKIVAAGGRRLTPVLSTPRCTICYCQDPFGTVLEVVDRPFEAAHAPTSPSAGADRAMR
jgi:catechol 2,3-dioxygenase-like lactoylglutathione lyase family enzyme